MKTLITTFLLCLTCTVLVSCNSGKAPDVSNINFTIQLQRFEQDLIKLDTQNVEAALNQLQNKYGHFLNDYIYNIQAFPPNIDTVKKYIKLFVADTFYKDVFNTIQKQYSNLNWLKNDMELACKYYAYYFPTYKLPQRIITFMGPIEGIASALTTNGLAIGLQGYLGANYPTYNHPFFAQIYPTYKVRRFEKNYIVVNAMHNIIDDNFPEDKSARTLIEKIVELGKRQYILKQILPNAADTVLTGYTKRQLSFCETYEKRIWAFFQENNLLYETESNIIATYVNDGPKTPEISDECPGNVGAFVGYCIVKKWMEKQTNISLEKMMKTKPLQLFQESKYKP